MVKQTWGLHIRGYSSPSVAQQKLFAKRYPDTVAWHKLDQEVEEHERRAEEERVRKKYRASLTDPAPASNPR